MTEARQSKKLRDDGTVKPNVRWLDGAKSLDGSALAESPVFLANINRVKALQERIKGSRRNGRD